MKATPAIEYERGYKDGLTRAAMVLANPSCCWFSSWKPMIYRAVLLILGEAHQGQPSAWRGDMHPDFGKRQLAVDDFLYDRNK